MKTVIALDCGDMPPECNFTCGICIQEIKDTVESLAGVTGFSQRMDNHIEIEHDPQKTSPQDLLDAISRLPSGQSGFFIPTIVTA